MTVDLKIADVEIARRLGIPHYMGVELIAEYPCLYRTVYSKGLGFRYITDDSDDGFIFDLTGPDAGNTAVVILEKLKEKRFAIDISDAPNLTEVVILDEESNVYLSEDKTLALALREAAAKALKVEV